MTATTRKTKTPPILRNRKMAVFEDVLVKILRNRNEDVLVGILRNRNEGVLVRILRNRNEDVLVRILK